MPRWPFRVAIACLVYMALVLNVSAAPPLVWLALAEEGGPYAEAAAVLKKELGADLDLNINHWRALFAPRDEAPDLIVAVGVAALDGVIERLARRGDAWAQVPLLAVMVPQAVFEARLSGGQAGCPPFSAALLDQPLGRQLALIKQALPHAWRIGVLSGPQTRLMLNALDKEARTRIPLVAFSPAYVKAGALLAVYSTPAQVARRAAEMMRQWQPGRSLPVPHKPREFEVAVNERVAASLGLWIDAPAQIVAGLQRLEVGR